MVRLVKNAGVVVAFVGGVAGLTACPVDDRCSENACVAVDAGVGDAEAPDAAKPADCDDTADAISPAAKTCMDDDFALFVDGEAGDDANIGSKAKPLKKIGSAIAKVGSTGSAVSTSAAPRRIPSTSRSRRQ